MWTSYLARTMAATDANDLIYYTDASRNYDPSPHLDRITAPVLWINSADDYINPPELGIAERDGQAHAQRALHPHPHLRRYARPRHPHSSRGMEGLSGRVHEGNGAQTVAWLRSSPRKTGNCAASILVLRCFF